MEWYLTCQRFTDYRNKQTNEKKEPERHIITHAQRDKRQLPFKTNTSASDRAGKRPLAAKVQHSLKETTPALKRIRAFVFNDKRKEKGKRSKAGETGVR